FRSPGFKLSKMIAEGVRNNPHAELVLMEKHGLVVWGDSSESCYHKTISIINEAESFIQSKVHNNLFGGKKYESLPEEERKDLLAKIMPIIRGAISNEKKMLLHYDDSSKILDFVNSVDAPILANVGAACPDHLVHTKRVPLFIDWDPASKNISNLIEKIKEGINQFKKEYELYFEQNKNEGDIIAETAPRVILIPGVGMINTGKSSSLAKVSGELYHRAIAVMQGASVLGNFVSLNEKESFDIEYWPLELYKLSLAPKEAEFSRKVAFITGGAGGIGSATCKRLAAEGAHVIVKDLNLEGAERVAAEINQQYGEGRAKALKMDVSSEEQVQEAYKQAVLTYGGIDIIVNNAGLA